VILTVLILYYSSEWQYLHTYTSRERADYFIQYTNQLDNLKLKLILPEQEVVIFIHSLVFSLEGPAWQEPEPRHVTGMALAYCILGKFLGVVCHCFPLPLDVPTLAARCLRPQRRERS